MRVLLVITGLGVGGAEKQVCDLADAFADCGHEVRLVYLTGEALVLPRSSSIDVIGLSMEKSVSSFFLASRKLGGILTDFRPDVVHSHMFHANIMARVVRLWQKIPRLICTAHNTSEGGKLRSLLYRLTDSLADISTNVSQEAVDAFVADGAVRKGRMIPVYNGIDLEKFSPAVEGDAGKTKQDEILLAVGRLYPQKDYPNLLRAFSTLVRDQERNKLRLDIVGDGPEREYLEALSVDLGIAPYVDFKGIRSDVANLMRAADVFVLSSAWEGFGLVVAEAMACEKLVVATDCGGVAEVLGGHGVLVPPRDSDALARALAKAFSMPQEERSVLGREAREHIRQTFSLEAVVGKWLALYEGGSLKTRQL